MSAAPIKMIRGFIKMINKLLSIPLLVTLALPSCTTVQSARDQLEDMSQTEYQELQSNVYMVSHAAGIKLRDALADKPELLAAIRTLAVELERVVQNDTLSVNDVIVYLVDRFADDLDLKPEYQEYIRDGAKVIDAAVGQIRLGIDGKLTEREKGLILALLGGLERGLS
jgi:hypothetical protein